MKNYSIVLDRKKAKAFSVFLHSLGIGYVGSECGEHIYFNIYIKESLKPMIETFLDKI